MRPPGGTHTALSAQLAVQRLQAETPVPVPVARVFPGTVGTSVLCCVLLSII